jgi:general transcription factor IIIA
LITHKNVTHLGRRDFVCPEKNCQRAFGYKHLLQRHTAKAHRLADPTLTHSASDESGTEDSPEDPPDSNTLGIDMITGKAYAEAAHKKIAQAVALLCPYPHLDGITILESAEGSATISPQPTFLPQQCEYAFSRAYDLRRHLKAAHNLVAEKDHVDQWVKNGKMAKLR